MESRIVIGDQIQHGIAAQSGKGPPGSVAMPAVAAVPTRILVAVFFIFLKSIGKTKTDF